MRMGTIPSPQRSEQAKRFGVMQVTLKLISCEADALYKAGLQLGELMLKNGNREVRPPLYFSGRGRR